MNDKLNSCQQITYDHTGSGRRVPIKGPKRRAWASRMRPEECQYAKLAPIPSGHVLKIILHLITIITVT